MTEPALKFVLLCAGLLMMPASPLLAASKPPIHAVSKAASAPLPPVLPACVPRRIEPGVPGAATYFQDCAEAPQMLSFAGGKFRMGDQQGNGLPYELPVHEVVLRPFALARFEVTNAQWRACVQASACSPDAGVAGAAADLPVVKVTWSQAEDYVQWLSRRTGANYRLPSEAEWEYAARAGSPDQYTWGNRTDSACAYANAFDQSGHREQALWNWQIECDDGHANAAPVGSYPPNRWGLQDMLGNVWEWVEDCWHSDYSGAPADGSAWESGGDCGKRVNRGGGWGNHPRALRVSNRDGDSADGRSDGLGFRVARDLAAAHSP